MALRALSLTALLVACTSTLDVAPDGASPTGPACASGTWCAAPTGCNWCMCAGFCTSQCTAGACNRDAGAFRVECDETHPCPSGACVFDQGCDAPRGRCVLAQCPAEGSVEVCGCDGVTIRTQCPPRPYRHAGACP